MARILFITWSGGGNLTPTMGLAHELRRQGYEVAFAGYQSQRERLESLGFAFTLLERSSAAFSASASPFAVVSDVFASTDHLRDVPEAVARMRPDALVVDCLLFGALAAAEDVSLPVAVLAHSAPGALAAPDSPVEGLMRAPVNAMRAPAGKSPVVRLWEAWGVFPTLCTTLAELDPLRAQMPPSFDYVGPIFEPLPPSGWRSPWSADDPRPLALVSFSTHGQWDQTSRIQRTLLALADRDYRVLVTTGLVDASRLRAPENAALVPYIPHAEVMPLASVCVTHAGHGTLVAALAAGVPLVCLPNLAADQPALAAQVEALGAGRALDGERATPTEIAAAVEDALANPSYAAAARRLAGEIAATSSVQLAARWIGALVTQSKP